MENARSNHHSPIWRRSQPARLVRDAPADPIPHAIMGREGVRRAKIRNLPPGHQHHELRGIRAAIRLDGRQASAPARAPLESDRCHFPGHHVPAAYPALAEMATEAVSLESGIPGLCGIRVLYWRVHPGGEDTDRCELRVREPNER